MIIARFFKNHESLGPTLVKEYPWVIVRNIETWLTEKLKSLDDSYILRKTVAIHRSARIEEHAVIKGPAIISAGCFVAAHAYLRNGVFLGENVGLGPGCEVKTSIILAETRLAHFNFVGDSLIGSDVNMEAGSVIANHYNERADKTISVLLDGRVIKTDALKFGAMIGDGSRIGANAVLSPGTMLEPGSIVKRLELVEQTR